MSDAKKYATRIGFAVNRGLYYGKVGAGWVGNNGFTVTDLTTGQVFDGDTSHTLSGWMADGGIEYAFSDNWSGKFEYDYIELGSRTFTLPGLIIPALPPTLGRAHWDIEQELRPRTVRQSSTAGTVAWSVIASPVAEW